MASITQHYGINGPVPFLDVDVASDNSWFLDPHRIRLAPSSSPVQQDAVRCLDTFFDQAVKGVSSNGTDREAARTNMHVFNEPRETRLGMSDNGFNGHGAAEELGDLIWEQLTTNLAALIDVALLKHLEHLPMYVEGIDRDITSDITTRIVFGPLADFTALMLTRFPEFTSASHRPLTVRKQVWDPAESAWDDREMDLPVAGGEPLLLVPKSWVGKHLLMGARRFYDTSLLSYVQDDEAVVGSDGRIIKTPKKALKNRSTLQRGRDTHIEVTKHAYANGIDLVALFEAFVLSRPIRTAA